LLFCGIRGVMDFQQAWERALKETEIVRTRVSYLHTFDDTRVPYVFLSPSQINMGDTVVRKGEVTVRRPSLLLPPNIPQFEGFDLEQDPGADKNAVINFLLVRGISVPSMQYNNKTHSLDVFEGDVPRAVAHFANQMERQEDVSCGLLTGHEDVWQFAVLIFICSQVARNTEVDLKRLMDDHRRRVS
jgi:hypothetical protein